MHKQLITLAFKKAKQEKQRQGVLTPSETSLANLLSDFIFENSKCSFGEKSLRNYHKSALKKNDRTNIKQQKVINSLCTYLGYKDYPSFFSDNSDGITLDNSWKKKSKKKPNNPNTYNTTNFKTIMVASILFFSVVIIIPLNRTRWMVWKDYRYVETRFSPNKFHLNQLKLYRKNHVLYFKKIKKTDCNTPFYNSRGKANVWYGVNINNELEYFTCFGLHPETGTPLKPITNILITAHICSSFN